MQCGLHSTRTGRPARQWLSDPAETIYYFYVSTGSQLRCLSALPSSVGGPIPGPRTGRRRTDNKWRIWIRMNGGLRHGVTSLNVVTSREDAPIDLLSGMPLPVALRTEVWTVLLSVYNVASAQACTCRHFAVGIGMCGISHAFDRLTEAPSILHRPTLFATSENAGRQKERFNDRKFANFNYKSASKAALSRLFKCISWENVFRLIFFSLL